MDKYLKILSYDVFNIEKNESKFLIFDQLYQYFCLMRAFKFIQCVTNDHFSDRFSELISTHTFYSRFSINQKLNYPLIVNYSYYKSFECIVVDLWNNVPLKEGTQTTLVKFKRYLHQVYFQTNVN